MLIEYGHWMRESYHCLAYLCIHPESRVRHLVFLSCAFRAHIPSFPLRRPFLLPHELSCILHRICDSLVAASFCSRCLKLVVRAHIMNFSVLKLCYFWGGQFSAALTDGREWAPTLWKIRVPVLPEYFLYFVNIIYYPLYLFPEIAFPVLFPHGEFLHLCLDKLVNHFQVVLSVVLRIRLVAAVWVRDVCNSH